MNKAIGTIFIIAEVIVALHANVVKPKEDCQTCCELPNTFANGQLRTVLRNTRGFRIVPSGSVLQFKCDNQYVLTGAERVTCNDGVWSPQLPVCVALRANLLENDTECTLPIHFANGKLRTVKRESRGLPIVPEGSVLQFKCNDGYELVGARIVTCKHGVWFPQLPACAALRANLLENDTECTLPIHFANGKLRTVKRESRGLSIVPEGSVLQFKCHDGYELEGASRVICRHGVWFPRLPVCAANHTAISKNENECNDGSCCEMPANFTNGKVHVNSNTHGGSIVPEFSSLQFLCDVGYTIHPTDSSLCLQGNWLPKLPSCVSVNCLPPPPLDNGRIIFDSEDSEFRPGTRISYECEDDYTLIKESLLVCARADGESIWVGELPKCKAKIRCEDPGEDPNGERRGPCCDEGDVINYVCTEDYDTIGPSAIICTEAGIWNDTKPTCQPEVFCPVPDVIRNGQIKQIKVKGRGGFYLPDDEIMIICDEGYTVGNESDYLYCETNGQWDDEIPKCKSTVNCDVPEPPENGYILELLHDKNITEFPYNFEINFICNPGYRLIGDSWRSCGEDGWRNEIPKCEEIQCPYPGRPDNGWIQGTDYQIGNVTFFGCYSGGSLLGSAKRVCLENGRWSGELARCNNRDNYCPNPGIPTGGRRYGSSYDLGAEVTFQCDIGRILTGSVNRTCQMNRKWSGEETECFSEHDFDNKKLVGKKIKSILSEETMNQEVKMDNFKSSYERNGSDDRARAIDLNFPGRLIFMFIFDVSGSIGDFSFKRSIEFAKAMVKTVKVTEDGVRVGTITFSNEAKKEFYPMDYSTTEDVLEALDKIEHKKGGTAASSALTLLQEMIPLITKVLGRKSKIIAFVITDGKANMAGDPANDATKLKESGVEIYCIGITGDRRMQTLYDIASSRKEHVFILDSYESLNWLVQDIVNDTIDYSKCGLRQSIIVQNKNEDERGRAIGGKKVIKPWPWMAVIFTVDPVEKDTTLPLSVCGGSIIDRKWILTAAHCMHQTINNEFVWKTKDEIIIHFGLTDLRNKTYVQERLMLRYITHRLYDPKTFDYDIALIEIERPLVYREFVRPVCLPPSENDLHEVPRFYRANEEAKAVGWGHTTSLKEKELSNARYVDISRSVSLPLQERETCQNSLKNRPKNNIFTDQMICAGGNGKDTCRGDSGGPLMQELTDEFGEEYWTQVGIISWGYECGQRGVYGFYTKVSMFKEWIEDTMKRE